MAFIYSLTDTWNNGGVTFTGIGLNVTDSASTVGSLLLNLQVGGSSVFSVSKFGAVASPSYTGASGGFSTVVFHGSVGSNANASVRDGIGLVVRSGSGYSWTSAATNAGSGAIDLTLARDAADTLAQRNGVNAQTFRVYNTFTDASNYERGVMGWTTNILRIGMEAAGTGTNRTVQVVAGAATYSFNANDIAVFPATGGIEFTTRFRFSSPALGIVRLTEHNGANAGALELPEWAAAPAAPATNNVRIYAEDNGGGKTRLMARFATGAAVQIAIEP